MTMSIRNQLAGTVTDVHVGEIMATVKVHLDDGGNLTSVITREAADDLDLRPTSRVRALVRSTEIALSASPVEHLSITNQLPGTVTDVATGPGMVSVRVAVGGQQLTVVVTKDAAGALALAPGAPVVVLIKSTEVSLATD